MSESEAVQKHVRAEPGKAGRDANDGGEARGAQEPNPSKRVVLLRNAWNALGYNFFWWIGVSSAVRGDVWTGPVAMLAFVGIALLWTPLAQRATELRFLVGVMILGWGLDSVLHHFGVMYYPTSATAWGWLIAPPWIAALWLGFGTMPRFSLGWLKRQSAWLAVAFGAIGGPLAFFGGTRLGAIEPGLGLVTYGVLAVEYGFLMWAFTMAHARLDRLRLG